VHHDPPPEMRLYAEMLSCADAERVLALEVFGPVVLTTGCFDLLHLNHIRFLADAHLEARRRNGVLAVAVNSDASVRLGKPGRPLQDEHTRVSLIAALRVVDVAFIFADPDPARLLRSIRPAAFVKGREYADRQDIPERAVCRETGSDLLFLGPEKDRSTTGLIARLQSALK